MRLRILDWNTPWVWITAFFNPKAHGTPIVEFGLWRPHTWKRWWFHCWQWESFTGERGGYAESKRSDTEVHQGTEENNA